LLTHQSFYLFNIFWNVDTMRLMVNFYDLHNLYTFLNIEISASTTWILIEKETKNLI
jgi:hypothetical protein